MRYTGIVTELKPNEVFVFGSNAAGIHGAGAALKARQWGAEMGNGFGFQGRTYAIPTKDHFVNTLPIEAVKEYVDIFLSDARLEIEFPHLPQHTFLVTEIGCGLAGYTPADIAPLFRSALNVPNIILPESFHKILNNNE